MELQELQKRALEIQELYKKHNNTCGEKDWSVSEYAQGLVGDVGDLSKLILAKEGFRKIEDTDEKLKHELSDCLWSVLVIAHELGIDIEDSFCDTMRELEEKLKNGN